MTYPPPVLPRRPEDFEYPYPKFWDRVRRVFALDLGPRIKGIDVAPDYQWGEVRDVPAMIAAGYRFVFVQTNRGLWPHERLIEFCEPFFDAGMPIFPYALFYGTVPGEAQADRHLELAWQIWSRQSLKTPCMLDIEVRDGVSIATRVQHSEDWFRLVRQEAPAVAKYCSPALNAELLGNYPLGSVIGHVAHWTSAIEPAIPGGWTRAQTRFWQYGVALKHSWVPAVPGMASDVDVNYFFGTYSDLMSLTQTIGASASPSASHSPSESPSPSASPSEEDSVNHTVFIAQIENIQQLLNEYAVSVENTVNEINNALYMIKMELYEEVTFQSSSPSPSAQPVPENVYWFKITESPRANAFTYDRVNGAGNPEMYIYENSAGARVQCPLDSTCWQVIKNAIPADGGAEYFEISNVKGENSRKLFVKKNSGTVQE